jgi:hypothetical protein
MNGRFAANMIDDMHERMARLEDERDALAIELKAHKETTLFLARLLGKTMGERDRARETAAVLEQELMQTRMGEYRITRVNGHDG